jgi:hypothetical protein
MREHRAVSTARALAVLAATLTVAAALALDAPAVGKTKEAPKEAPKGELKSFWDDPCSFSFCILDKRGRTFAVAAITRKLRCHSVEDNVCTCRSGHRATAQGCRR